MEPPWLRFKLPPNVPFGNAGTPGTYGAIPNAHAMYANALVASEPNTLPGGDPATPVFTATAGEPLRMHVLNGASADRDGTWMLHGHLWQRDPFVCPGENDLGLAGRCDPSTDTVDSTALGLNQQGKWLATEEGMGHAYGHWPILLESAGGGNAIPGDYLYRDYAPNGNRNGQFGILRVSSRGGYHNHGHGGPVVLQGAVLRDCTPFFRSPRRRPPVRLLGPGWGVNAGATPPHGRLVSVGDRPTPWPPAGRPRPWRHASKDLIWINKSAVLLNKVNVVAVPIDLPRRVYFQRGK
jgi:hypothetical protein